MSGLLNARPPRPSALSTDPACWSELVRSLQPYLARLTGDERAALDETLRADLVSEYDARYLAVYLADLRLDFTPAFRAALASWQRDEELHCLGFSHVYAALHGRSQDAVLGALETRAADVDFAPLAHLFEDEFSIACLLAYDEIATVSAYRANTPRYTWLGPEFTAFARQVTVDEGEHSGSFLRVVKREHRHRLPEVARVVERIRSVEGVPYRNTFVLDHDDGVWSDRVFDEAARLVHRHLMRAC